MRPDAYSIIYSCDVPVNTQIIGPPPSQSHLWDCTERSGGSDGGQMDWGVDGYAWSRGRHRQYCAILDQEQFDCFVEHCELFAEDVETMGAIGTPAFGYSHAPAVSFNGCGEDSLQSAYVTPLIESNKVGRPLPGLQEQTDDVVWSELRSFMIDQYED